MPTRSHEYVITSTNNPKDVTHIWWDGKKIDSDDKNLLAELRHESVRNVGFDAGPEFLKVLPAHYRSGYLTCKKVKK